MGLRKRSNAVLESMRHIFAYRKEEKVHERNGHEGFRDFHPKERETLSGVPSAETWPLGNTYSENTIKKPITWQILSRSYEGADAWTAIRGC